MNSRLKRIAFLTAYLSAAGLAGCGGDEGETSDTPSSAAPAPAPVPSPAPAPASFSVTLAWSPPGLNTDGSSLTDVAGYQISYGTSLTNLSRDLFINTGNATSATVTGLAAGRHYFSIKTLNSSGALSAASAVVSRTVP